MIVIDFETRSRCNIKAGASRYSLDPSTECLCLSYKIGNEPVTTWRPGEPDPVDLLCAVHGGDLIWAHNVSFEMAIWANVMVARHDWPPVPLWQWRCTMAECLAAGLPASLESVGLSLQLPSSDLKDKAGHRVMLKMSKPRKPTKKNKKEWHDDQKDFDTLVAYCEQDVVAENAIHHRVPRLNNRELSVFQLDKKINARGVKIDRQLAKTAIGIWDSHTRRLNSEIFAKTKGRVKSANEVARLTRELIHYDLWTGKLRKSDVDAMLQLNIDPPARRLLEIRQELSKSSVSKYKAMLLSAESDDRIRGCLQYHGAQTGRFAGRLIQPQNFARGKLEHQDEIDFLVDLVKRGNYDLVRALSPLPVGELLSSLLRSAIVAEEGHTLLVADFAAIEARGLAWAAGEEWLLEAFRNKSDVYKHMASKIYKVPYDEVTKSQRFYGKTTTLGAGYSMGAPKFLEFLALLGVESSLGFCKTVIDAYRQENKNIVNLWRAAEKAAVATVATGKPHAVGPFVFRLQGEWLKCQMPAGRDINYYRPALVPGKYDKQLTYIGTNKTGKPAMVKTYGGKLVENFIQGLCRDLLVDAMGRLEQAGYTVILSVHDEIICEVPEGFGSIEEMERIMCEVPRWAEHFPISAEGFAAKRYRK
jgi:DNA polymerase bacteriophage-type